MQTRTKSATASEVAELRSTVSELSQLVRQLITAKPSKASGESKPKASKITVTIAQVKALSAEDFNTLRYSLVLTNADGSKKLERNSKGQKQYALVPKAQRAWYMGLKGLAIAAAGEGINETVAEGKDRSQMEFAQDLLSQMTAAGFIKLRQPKAASK